MDLAELSRHRRTVATADGDIAHQALGQRTGQPPRGVGLSASLCGARPWAHLRHGQPVDEGGDGLANLGPGPAWVG